MAIISAGGIHVCCNMNIIVIKQVLLDMKDYNDIGCPTNETTDIYYYLSSLDTYSNDRHNAWPLKDIKHDTKCEEDSRK